MRIKLLQGSFSNHKQYAWRLLRRGCGRSAVEEGADGGRRHYAGILRVRRAQLAAEQHQQGAGARRHCDTRREAQRNQ